MDKPLVSICIPTYNRAEYLVGSIKSALDQDYANIEVIVSDNNSTDNTQEVIQQFMDEDRFHYFRNSSNIGMVKNWKKMLEELVSGTWFILLSDDDYFIDESYVANVVALINQNANVGMVYANGYIEYNKMNAKEELNLPYSEIESGKNIFLTCHNIIPQSHTLCNVVFNTEIAKEVDAFSNQFNLCCDSELFLKSCLRGDVGVIKEHVSVYRIHGENLILQNRSIEQLIALAEDLFIAPQKDATELNIYSKSDLEKRCRDYVLPNLRDIFIEVHAINHGAVETVLNIMQKNGVCIRGFYNSPLFILKIFIVKFPKLYRLLKSTKKYLREL